MGKNKLEKKAKQIYKSLNNLEKSRTGGQIALSGFTYQFLYSCYLILSEKNENVSFVLEGLEDIDRYKCNVQSDKVTHIQIKYSTQKKDASFMKDILKNYLEVFLLDNTHEFKLIYDFDIAQGNLKKLINNSLDEKSEKYWNKIIEQIMEENIQWDWNNFSSSFFLSKISFEKQVKDELSLEIEKLLIERYNITTDNIKLYANGIKVCCLEKMECRESLSRKEIDSIIYNIKEDISKGIKNPAHGWIEKIKFNIPKDTDEKSYFEGKKATPQDIVLKLPVRRTNTEKEIENSIKDNKVTVIKASSGQGKTTIAFQVAFNLSNEYHIYQLRWCNDAKELNNIIKYFKARIKVGEKLLIVIDNLDSQLSEWNRLAQLLQEEVICNYKLLLTSREDDWYSYSGNLSNVKSLKIVEIFLNAKEAEDIFIQLKKRNLLYYNIKDWKYSWGKIGNNKKLLIEYVYLLTHGQMISERINQQIITINKSINGKIKCEILRIICFADICGIKISIMKLIDNLEEDALSDYGEILKSIENEFLIRVDNEENFIEGLHPVRSMHIVERLHEFYSINNTAINVIKLTDLRYLSKLFSNLPKWINNREEIYDRIVKLLWSSKSLSTYIMVLKGLLSGSIDLYFRKNKELFDDANNHGGLFLVATELNPFNEFIGFDFELTPLKNMKKLVPDNNIKYLCSLSDKINKFNLVETDIFFFCNSLFELLKDKSSLVDLSSYALISYWLININKEFNLSNQIDLNNIWENKSDYNVEIISNIMYTCFCGNREKYLSFVEENLEDILIYLKHSTESLEIFLDKEKSEIHVKYVLITSNIKNGNKESVERLKIICKTLPIYKIYCADAISPKLDILLGYDIPNEAKKAMPIRNIIIMFNHNFSSIWNSTIMSNYECDSMLGWVNQWISLRKKIVCLFNQFEIVLHKLLKKERSDKHINILDNLRFEISKNLIREIRYPNQDRPFEENIVIQSDFSDSKEKYFSSVRNFISQLNNILLVEQENSRLAMLNLLEAKDVQSRMQIYFKDIINNQDLSIDGDIKLCKLEREKIEALIMTCEYYMEHKPSEYFSKYSINLWYKQKKELMVVNSKNALGELNENYDVYFPIDYYSVNNLKYYPIIANNLNVENIEDLIKFLYLCFGITEDYDFLVIAIGSNNNKIMSNGLKITCNFLKELRIAIEEENYEIFNKRLNLFPEKISIDFLSCFKEKVNILEVVRSQYEGIDGIFELLWSYSISRDILINKFDSEYLSFILMKYKNQIKNLIEKFESNISIKEVIEIKQLCDNVYRGKSFGNLELNNYINKLILCENKKMKFFL